MKISISGKNVWKGLRSAVTLSALVLAISSGVANAQWNIYGGGSGYEFVTSTTSQTAAGIYIGGESSNTYGTWGNGLHIGAGATVTTSEGISIGRLSTATNNSLIVSGATVSAYLTSTPGDATGNMVTVGREGGNNNLIIADGSTVSIAGTNLRVGYAANWNKVAILGSTVNITGGPSTNSSHICLGGYTGSNNQVIIANASYVTSGRAYIGGMMTNGSCANNSIKVIGDPDTTPTYLELTDTVNPALNIGYSAMGGMLGNMTGNSLDIYPFGYVFVDSTSSGTVRVNAANGNTIRIAKTPAGDSGALWWAGDHTATGDNAIPTLIAAGAFSYSDNSGATWTTTTSAGVFSVSYSGGYTIVTRP